jgi:membrane-associated protein
MRYSAFALYNVVGAVLWVGICVGAGYAFGNVPVIKENFSLVALGIVAVSMIPMAVEWVRHQRKRQRI